MAENSKIEWCDHTFNPWRACTKVWEGCAHCYAETLSKRNPTVLGEWGPGKPRVKASPAMWQQPLKWDREAGAAQHENEWSSDDRPPDMPRPRVFCASLADWLDDEVPIEWLAELMELIMRTPNLDWLLLTKRPQNFKPRLEQVLQLFPRNCLSESESMLRVRIEIMLAGWSSMKHTHPKLGCQNYWIGTTVENQARADERIPLLLDIPAKVRFLSCEPLLEEVSLGTWLDDSNGVPRDLPFHWVICGGESGTHARAMHPEWARSLRDQCSAAGVPFFFKQWGEWLPGCQYREGDRERFRENAQHSFCHDHHSWWVGKKLAGRMLDDRTHDEFPQVERRPA